MRTLLTVADRTAVLFLGVAAGVAIGFAFGRSETPPPAITGVQADGGTATNATGDGAAGPAIPAETAPPPPTGPEGNASEGAAKTADNTPAAQTDTAPPAPAGQAAALPPPGPPPPFMAEDRATRFAPHLLQSIAAGRKVRVGVFGDSYGDGIWSALYHVLPAKAGYEVAKLSQQSTGFTRYGSLNLEQHAREQLSGNPVDIAVVSFGANDTQGVLSGHHAAALLSPEWQQIVGQRVEGFVNELRAQGAVVYWVGLPKMRKPQFDADIAGMNLFYARKMKELGVPWIETASLTVDGSGQFAPYLPDGPDNERKLMRANDGIHMSYAGYVRITRALVGRINAYVAAARRAVGPVAPPPPPATTGAGT